MSANCVFFCDSFVCINTCAMKSEKSEIQLHIIDKLKKLRQTNNVSQAMICEIIEVSSAGQVGNIESVLTFPNYLLK
jgi:putative transcriptional regulator